MKSGVGLYGGFTGTETAREQRNWETNLSVLSGDIGVTGDKDDNSCHVVIASEVEATAILNGFTITGGYGPGSPCINYDTYYNGGGMHNSNSNPTLTNVIFIGNIAVEGGGMYNVHSNPTLTNVTFINNYASYGGGMYNIWSYNYSYYPELTNVTFSGNRVTVSGSGIYNKGSSPTIINTIMWGNTSQVGGPLIYNINGSTPFIRYSNVEGGCESFAGNDCSEGGNLNTDPIFARNPNPGPDGYWATEDDDYGDLRLQNDSLVIDAGDNTQLPDWRGSLPTWVATHASMMFPG